MFIVTFAHFNKAIKTVLADYCSVKDFSIKIVQYGSNLEISVFVDKINYIADILLMDRIDTYLYSSISDYLAIGVKMKVVIIEI